MERSTLGIITSNYTRESLKSLAENRTIATIPFGGRYRLIDFPLSNLVNSGIKTVGLITPYYYRSIMDHVGAGKPWELARKTGGLFILPGSVFGEREQKGRFLLRDMILNRKILDRSHSDYVLVCDSSTVMNCDFTAFIHAHAESGAQITLMYKDEAGRPDRAYLKTKKNGRVSELVRDDRTTNKMFLGCFIINREFLLRFLDWYKAIEYLDVIDIISRDIQKFDVNSYEYTEYAAVIDTIADYKKASTDLLEHEVRIALFEQDRLIYTKTQDETPTIYKSSANVRKSLIAAGCVIEGTVENSIIFRSTHIKKNAVVKNSIIMQRNTIESNATVINAICDKYVHVGRKAHIEGSDENPIVIVKDTII